VVQLRAYECWYLLVVVSFCYVAATYVGIHIFMNAWY
jgi:hypothetical protein